ncbi:hypothetical protein SAMN02745163_02897 [Clostridium cavendishii DSM 21758]|uniref:Uncharacterized protein n=1 Tax=Clostridium cavendishii DSM 21758 TaxID=1121302 RepID=A0A1M6NFZ3_9CLOT|nr:DUF6179 domain-containing protein [Clostridium cavendishii]SHJ94617.1 hypothetical protein SAMN02745163_02897 [Clostridium cavendishii DSM 21758]
MKSSLREYVFLDKISEESFFKDILLRCYEKKILDDYILSKIYSERMELLREKLKYYTKDDSSSVMIEIAEKILNSIDYTIGIYLKSFNDKELIIDQLKNISLSEMLQRGQDLISEKVLESRLLFDKISENKLAINNYSYNDTINDGLSLFFKEYDAFFYSHETPCSIDYQLSFDNINYVGVEYMYNYLNDLNLENEFCNKFDIAEIVELLKGYDEQSEVLLINVFELVLVNALGVLICGKDLNSLNISNLDRDYIKNNLEKLSFDRLQEELLKHMRICCESLNIKNENLIAYMETATLKITSLVNESIKINKLEKVFISFKQDIYENNFKYIDGEKMPNSKFKDLTEEIRDCSLVNDKIILIKENIKSLEDLIDMLNAECLFDDEYIKYFKSLSKFESSLLSKYVCNLNFEGEYEKEWYNKFYEYILSLSDYEKREISEIKEKIQI